MEAQVSKHPVIVIYIYTIPVDCSISTYFAPTPLDLFSSFAALSHGSVGIAFGSLLGTNYSLYI